jgi:hypothetical protein
MSLRERLRAKSLPTAEFRLRVTDDGDAQAKLVEAQYALRLAENRDEGVAKAKTAVTKAQAKLDEHYEVLILQALPPAELEALIAAHPAEKKDDAWNEPTFRPALLAACVEGDMTEQDWTEFCSTGGASLGEVKDLYLAALRVNERGPDPSVGKDWERILGLR